MRQLGEIEALLTQLTREKKLGAKADYGPMPWLEGNATLDGEG